MTLAFFEPRPALETVLSQAAGPHLTIARSRPHLSPQPRTGLTRKVLQMGLWRLSLLPVHLPRASGRSPCLRGTPHSQLLGEGGILAVPCPSILSSPPWSPRWFQPWSWSPHLSGPPHPTAHCAQHRVCPPAAGPECAQRESSRRPRAWKSHQNRPAHLWGAATCASRWGLMRRVRCVEVHRACDTVCGYAGLDRFLRDPQPGKEVQQQGTVLLTFIPGNRAVSFLRRRCLECHELGAVGAAGPEPPGDGLSCGPNTCNRGRLGSG